jgi:hypothetical protein
MDPTDEPEIIRFPGMISSLDRRSSAEIESIVEEILLSGLPVQVKIYQILQLIAEESAHASRVTAREILESRKFDPEV